MSPAEPAPRLFSIWVCLGIGAGAALFGLLPWVVTGMRLPLQNLWASSDIDSMPVAFLPFSQYAVSVLVGILVTGSALGGLAVRATRARQPRFGFLATLAGILVIQAIATVQTAVVVYGGLVRSSFATLYFAGLLGGIVFSIALGAVAAGLLGKAPAAGAIVGASFAAVGLSLWLTSAISPFGSLTMPPSWLLALPRWVPGIVVGVAIAWWGIASVGRVIAAAFALFVLWVAPALATGAGSALGARVYASDPAAMLDFGLGVLRSALFIPELALPPILLAVIVAVLGLIVRTLATRRRPAEA